jgi:hypothetical protein
MRRFAVLPLLAALTVGRGGEDPDFDVGEPAPPSVTRLIVEEGTAERLGPLLFGKPDAIEQAAHGVAALETSKGRVLLWTAPGAGNAICYFVEFERLSERSGSPQGEANCGHRPIPTTPVRTVPILLVLHRATIDRSDLAILVGLTHESVKSVALRSPEGDEHELALFENLFIAEIPADRVPKDLREGKAYEVVAKDRAGTELPPLAVTEFASWREKFPKVTGPKRTVIDTTDSAADRCGSRSSPSRAARRASRRSPGTAGVRAAGRYSVFRKASRFIRHSWARWST